MIPKDPVILLSYVNTQLRDHDSSLDAFCSRMDADKKEIMEKLEMINYFYDEEKNQFI